MTRRPQLPPPSLCGGFEEARFLDPETGLPWLVARLFMIHDLVTLGSQRHAGLAYQLAACWAVSIARSRPVLFVTRHPDDLMSAAYDTARTENLEPRSLLQELQLYVRSHATDTISDWDTIAQVARETQSRLVVVVRGQGPHSESDIAGYRELTEMGNAVVVAMAQVDSVVAAAADVCLTVEQVIGTEYEVEVHKGHRRSSSVRYSVIEGVPQRMKP